MIKKRWKKRALKWRERALVWKKKYLDLKYKADAWEVDYHWYKENYEDCSGKLEK